LSERRNLIVEAATVLAFCAFLQYFGAAAIGLAGADEPRYAQIAREMLARHDWVTPVLYGQPWFEKPVLYYWSAMTSYSIFGVSDWAARLPAATFATAAVLAIWAFLRRFRPGAQTDGALMTACSVALIGFGRSAGPDMLLAATVTIAMLAWMAWRLSEEKRWLAAFYFFSALGMLAKGPVAPALAGAVIVLFALLRREPRTILRTLWLPGIALFLVVALPWYVLVQMRNPEFFRIFVLEHNLARFSTNLFRHQQPFWYYAPVVLLGTLPWTIYWLAAVIDGFRRWREESDGLRQFLLLWSFFVLFFFSISRSKLPGYILPALPACTLLAAEYVHRREGARPNFTLLTLHAAVLATLVAGVLLVPYAMAHAANAPRVTASVLAAIAFVATSWTVWRSGLRMLRFVTVVPMIVLLAFLLRVAAPVLDAKASYRQAAAALDGIDGRHSQLAIYKSKREAEYGLAYYRNQVVPRYGRDPIPAGDHMVIAPAGAEEEVMRLAGGRRVSRIGEYAPQKLVFYWVSRAVVHSH
jgi:4-amino-4-deoxy-L-arabinose transferase-like glycosyltransferase